MVHLAHEKTDMIILAFSLGYVGGKYDRIGGPARSISQQSDMLIDPYKLTPFANIAADDFEGGNFLGKQLLLFAKIGVAILGMQKTKAGQFLELMIRIA